MLFNFGDDFAHRFVHQLALGEFTDVLQTFGAIELTVGRQAEHLHDAANLLARQPLVFRFHKLKAF